MDFPEFIRMVTDVFWNHYVTMWMPLTALHNIMHNADVQRTSELSNLVWDRCNKSVWYTKNSGVNCTGSWIWIRSNIHHYIYTSQVGKPYGKCIWHQSHLIIDGGLDIKLKGDLVKGVTPKHWIDKKKRERPTYLLPKILIVNSLNTLTYKIRQQ